MDITEFNPRDLKIEELKGGKILKQMNIALSQVLLNCADQDLKQDQVRELTMRIQFTPNLNRTVLSIKAIPSVKLVSAEHESGAILLQDDDEGTLNGVEFDPNQMEMFEDEDGKTQVRRLPTDISEAG